VTDTKKHNEALAIAYLTGQASASQIDLYRKAYAEEAGFRETVRDIEVWLSPLNTDSVHRTPPSDLYDSIMAEIMSDNSESAHKIVEAMNDNYAGRWKALAAAASIVAILAIGSHFIGPSPAEPVSNQSRMMALLSGEESPPLVAIIYNPETHEIVAKLSNVSVPEDGDLQLWLIREGKAGPVSLGVMEEANEDQSVSFAVPENLQDGTDILAISLEQKGGSKSAGPEGPVLYTGAIGTI
jgi:anti-sigma-K factor RskA